MIVNPDKEYTLTELFTWFQEAQQKQETLFVNPCNPSDVPFLQTSATINCRDDIACLTQWLGGLKP